MKHYLLLLLICLLVITGCQNNLEERETVEDQRNQIVKVKQPGDSETEEKDSGAIARHLVELASAVPDVEDATAIVAGNYAVVGIDVNSNLDRTRVGTIKYTVAEALKDDRYGANAVVTADADLVQRLRQMGQKINQGHPVTGIMDELAQIVNRIMPEAPSDLMETPDDTNPTDQNDEQLSKQEKQNLKNEQEKQDLDR